MEFNWLAFAGIAALMTLTPGVDTALVIRSALRGGQRAASLTTLGVCSGLVVHALASSLGLSAILDQSAQLFRIIKLTGAAYLIFLGVRTLWSVWKMRESSDIPEQIGKPRFSENSSPARFYLQGLLTNVSNPKVAVFYLTLLPQFIDVSQPAFPQALSLAGIHIAQGMIWLWLCGRFVSFMRQTLARPSIWRGIESLSGSVLVAFGLTIALEDC